MIDDNLIAIKQALDRQEYSHIKTLKMNKLSNKNKYFEIFFSAIIHWTLKSNKINVLIWFLSWDDHKNKTRKYIF